jgi:hypothetical protein
MQGGRAPPPALPLEEWLSGTVSEWQRGSTGWRLRTCVRWCALAVLPRPVLCGSALPLPLPPTGALSVRAAGCLEPTVCARCESAEL